MIGLTRSSPWPESPGDRRRRVGAFVLTLTASFAGVMILAILLASLQSQAHLRVRLQGDITLAVASTDETLESPEAVAGRALEWLKADPSVIDASAEPADPQDNELAEGLLATPRTRVEGRLLAVRLRPGALRSEVLKRLRRPGVMVAIDDHGWLTSPLRRGLALKLAIGGLALGGLLSAFSLAISQVVRVRLADNLERVVQLSKWGMSDLRLMFHLTTGESAGIGLGLLTGAFAGAEAAGQLLPVLPGLLFANNVGPQLASAAALIWIALATCLALTVAAWTVLPVLARATP